MSLVKALGLAAMAALAAMAFLGVQAASAETSTVLCLEHTSLVCPEGQALENSLIHANLVEGPFGNEGKLLNNTVTVLCLGVLATLLTGELAEPPTKYTLHTDGETHKVTYSGCGTTSTHNNCEIEETEGSLLLLLKTGLDHGTLKGDGGKTHVHCLNVTIFKITLDCTYEGTGLEFLVGEQKLHADHSGVILVERGLFCPEESSLDGLLEVLPYELEGGEKDPIYILE